MVMTQGIDMKIIGEIREKSNRNSKRRLKVNAFCIVGVHVLLKESQAAFLSSCHCALTSLSLRPTLPAMIFQAFLAEALFFRSRRVAFLLRPNAWGSQW